MSQIQQFYSQTNILITGGTGFLGKILIQKLLRTCNKIEGMYLLIRAKNDKTASQRVDEIFQDVVFDVLKKEEPNFLNKIHVIEGDCSLMELGLSEQNKNLLTDKISIVFHCAGLLMLNANLKEATRTNVRSLKDILALCHKMQNLKSMVFVSTAYSNCQQNTIEEKFYDVPIQPSMLLEFLEECDDRLIAYLEQGCLQNSPNMYCFTKSIAEHLLLSDGKNLPVCLFRPSIVMPTYLDPIPGWTSNVYGPLGLTLASALGILRVVPCKKSLKVDLVPADFTINSLICVAWETNKKWKSPPESENSIVPVYHYSSGYDRNMTWEKYESLMLSKYKYKLSQPLWICWVFYVTNKFAFNILSFLFHAVPGYILDAYLFLTGQKLKFTKLYKKINKFIGVLHYFMQSEWNIVNSNVTRLWQGLNVTDQELFPFDIDLLNYEKYFESICLGLKVYILNESLDDAEAANKKHKKLETINRAVVTIITILLLLFCYKIVRQFL